MANSPIARTWSSYLSWLVGAFLVAVTIVGLINVFVDPLNVLSSPQVVGLNATKPYLDHHRELTRYVAAQRICANTGIFGNSRAEIGFDPEGSKLIAHGLSGFNHAIPGTGLDTTYRQLLWLEAANCMPKTIFLGVDFFDFLGGSVRRPLATLKTAPTPQVDLGFLAEVILSVTGLQDSVHTVLLQSSRYPASSTPRGFNPLLNYIPEVEQSGHYVLFRQRAEENLRTWALRTKSLRPRSGEISGDEAILDAILAKSAQTGGTIYLIIYPYHAQIRIMIERLGLGSLLSAWKRSLVVQAEKLAASGQHVEVWDFSGITAETSEPIPMKGDRKTSLLYYWEAGHFKKELGELVIARVLGAQGTFGIKLDKLSIENWLIEDRQRVQALGNMRSSLTIEVDDIFMRVKQK